MSFWAYKSCFFSALLQIQVPAATATATGTGAARLVPFVLNSLSKELP